jgi:DNA-binding MarR family transcriptional regulator
MPKVSTPSDLTDPQRLNDLLLFRLSRISSAAGAAVVRLCEGGHGITRREWRLLAQLADAGGPLTPSTLAERVQLDRARTSRALSSLVAKALVSRHLRAGDHRFAQVTLTPTGHALHAALFPQVAAINRRLLDGLDAAQVEALQALLDHLDQQAAQAVPEADGLRADRHRGRR